MRNKFIRLQIINRTDTETSFISKQEAKQLLG